MIVLSHGDERNNGTVQYNFNVVRFIAVTPPMTALRFLCIISAFNARSMPESFILAVTVSWTEPNPSLCSLHQASGGVCHLAR